MRALFVTTHTNDTHNHVDAWDSASETPAKRIHFNYHGGLGNDAYILHKARAAGDVDVIFYIGCNRGGGLPTFDTLRELRKMAPLVNIVSDAADVPWHPLINAYRREECFDLQVGIDGDPESPVDLVTLTPVDNRAFDAVKVAKDIRCGFSGNAAGKRVPILGAVGSRCWVRIRGDDYLDHVRFLKRCRMILNIAYTGTGQKYHCKGRVTETGYAGAALIEPMLSPTKHWFPTSSFLQYQDTDHLIEVLEATGEQQAMDCAHLFSKIVREKYSAGAIYGKMLDALDVAHSLS